MSQEQTHYDDITHELCRVKSLLSQNKGNHNCLTHAHTHTFNYRCQIRIKGLSSLGERGETFTERHTNCSTHLSALPTIKKT